MDQINLSRRTVTIIAAAFALLLVAAFWWKLNPAWAGKSTYYKDAARIQAQEGEIAPTPKHATPPPVAGDKAYQPESGN